MFARKKNWLFHHAQFESISIYCTFPEFREARLVETTTNFPDTTTDIVSDSTEPTPAPIIQFTVNNGSNIAINPMLDQLENDKEDDEQDDTGHHRPGKPANNNVIVGNNPTNNIIVEAPVITTIIGGHPYPGSYY